MKSKYLSLIKIISFKPRWIEQEILKNILKLENTKMLSFIFK